MRTWMSLLVAGALAGCASSAPAQRFTGDPYDVVEHDGLISGDVCGLNVNWAESRKPGYTELLGHGIHRLEVRDEHGARHITGAIRGTPVASGIDLWVAADRIVGHFDTLEIDLRADGDSYRGSYHIAGDPHAGDMTVDGRQEILRMPRALLAALMPPMLRCNRRGGFASPYRDPVTRQPVVVRFGGPPHYQTLAGGRW